jgi:ADP-heptose:LPS heptosyltransferase
MAAKDTILVLQMQRMGDLILSFPLFLWLKRQHPDAEILVAAEESFYKPLMPLSPQVTYVSWKGVDYLIDSSHRLLINLSIAEKAAKLAGMVRAEKKIGPEIDARGVHRIHGNWQLYRAGLVNNNRYNRYHWADLNALDVVPLKRMAETRWDMPRSASQASVGLFLGASEESKRPPAEFWASLASRLVAKGLRPMLFGGPGEKKLGRKVHSLCEVEIPNFCGAFNLSELASAGQGLSLFITPDTGPMHLAAWTGLKVLNLSMGNVCPLETGPYQPGHYILRPAMECSRGCWQCSRGDLICREAFRPARIAELAAEIVQKGDTEGKDILTGDLNLYRSVKNTEGLRDMQLVHGNPDDPCDKLSRFWFAWFGMRFGLWGREKSTHAWQSFSGSTSRGAEAFRHELLMLGKELRKRFVAKDGFSGSFWATQSAHIRPYAGFLQLRLQNADYSVQAWTETMDDLESLLVTCS